MNKKKRLALILIFIAIILLVLSLFVRAALNSDFFSKDVGVKSAGDNAEISLTVLPPNGIEDKGSDDGK